MRISQIEFTLRWLAGKVPVAGENEEWRAADGDTPAGRRFAPLLRAASIFTDAADARIMARMLQIDARQLVACCEEAVRHGVLVAGGDVVARTYKLADPRAAAAAHATLGIETLRSLHSAAAEAFEEDPGPRTATRARQIAVHREAAGDWRLAIEAWRLAASLTAPADGAEPALECLEKAVAIARTHANGSAAGQELTTLNMMGPLLAQIHGSGSAKVAAVYARCLVIAETFDSAAAVDWFDILWGVCACVLVHGRIGTAREMAIQLLRSACHSGQPTHMVLARRLQGLSCLLAGDIRAAIDAFAMVELHADAPGVEALRDSHASDQLALALAHKAWALAIAGDEAGSQATGARALDRAVALHHPHTSAHVTCVLAACAQTLGRRDLAGPLASAGLAIAQEHSFPYWQAWAQLIIGWQVSLRKPEEGAERLDRAIQAYRETGAGQALPFAFMLRTEAALAAADRGAATAAATQGIAMAQAHGVHLFDAELLRLQALAAGYQRDRRELLLRASAIAAGQGAHLFEARARHAIGGLAMQRDAAPAR